MSKIIASILLAVFPYVCTSMPVFNFNEFIFNVIKKKNFQKMYTRKYICTT